MDTLTHSLSGLIAARLVPVAGLPMRSRYLAGMLAANMPDLDILLAPFSSEFYLLHHRGETHSLLLLPLWALLLAWLLARVFKAPEGWRDFYNLSAAALLVHIFTDWITGYGTQLFAPFTHQTYALGTTFIIDPLLSLIFLLGYLGSLWKKSSPMPAGLSALAALLWIGLQYVWMQKALDIGQAYARTQGWDKAVISAEPRPIAPFNWTVIIREGERYHFAHVNLHVEKPQVAATDASGLARALAEFQPPQSALWQTAEKFGAGKDSMLARDAWSRPQFAFFRWFASAPALYRIDHQPHGACVWFEDLRFAVPGRESPFRFGMCGPDWQSYRLDRDGQARPFH